MLCGNLQLLNKNCFAVVGTRNITPYGEKYCKKICSELSIRKIPIISGMAVGVDTVAHKTALQYDNETIAVLPCGFKHIYPVENIKLFEEILKNRGLILTEYEEDVSADSNKFIKRHRIIAGMGEGLFVVEALYRSGTSITAKLARKYGKKVFALPGSLDNIYSYGTNNLIKNGAKLVTCIEDILNEYSELFNEVDKKINPKVLNNLDSNEICINDSKINQNSSEDDNKKFIIQREINKDELKNCYENDYKNEIIKTEKQIDVKDEFKDIIKYITDKPILIDELSTLTQINIKELNQKLILMELDNLIKYEYGRGYKLV